MTERRLRGAGAFYRLVAVRSLTLPGADTQTGKARPDTRQQFPSFPDSSARWELWFGGSFSGRLLETRERLICAEGSRQVTSELIREGFLSAAFACAMVGCHSAPKLTPQQAEGKHLYDAGCAHCHEENDLHLKKVPPNLHGLFERTALPDGEPATDREVEQVLMTGKGMMPSFAYQMTKEQMDALVAYLHSGLGDQQRQ